MQLCVMDEGPVLQATVRRQAEFVSALCAISEPWTATVSSLRVWINQLHQTKNTDGSFKASKRWKICITFSVSHRCQAADWNQLHFFLRCVTSVSVNCKTFAAVLRFMPGSGQIPHCSPLSLLCQHVNWLNNQTTCVIVAVTQIPFKEKDVSPCSKMTHSLRKWLQNAWLYFYLFKNESLKEIRIRKIIVLSCLFL